MKAAREGDPCAEELIRDGAEDTFRLVKGVLEHLDFPEEENVPVGVWGSAIVKNPLSFAAFADRMKKFRPAADVRIPQTDAAEGACRLALDILNGRTRFYRFEREEQTGQEEKL